MDGSSVLCADVREPELPSRGEGSETLGATEHVEHAGCVQDRLEILRI